MSFQVVIDRLVGTGKSITDDTLRSLATEVGHLLAERILTAAEAKQIRLGLVNGQKNLSDFSRSEILICLLSAYESSRNKEESEAEQLEAARNSAGQVWACSNYGDWRVIRVNGDDVSLQGPGPCRAYKSVPIQEFVLFWERVR